MATILKENAQAVLTYLQNNQNVDLTNAMLSEALDIPVRSIVGILNGLQKASTSHAQLIERIPVSGSKDKVIKLTEAGKAFDPAAEKPVAETA